MENKKITIQDIVDEVAAKGGFTKKYTEEFLRELFAVIQEYLEKDGVVKVKGLGTFKLVWNEERKSVNVTTQEEIVIPGHYKVSFVPESEVKERINEPYSHLSTIMHGSSATSAPQSEPQSGYFMPASELKPDAADVETAAGTVTPSEPACEPEPEPVVSSWAWQRTVDTAADTTANNETTSNNDTASVSDGYVSPSFTTRVEQEPEPTYAMPAEELQTTPADAEVANSEADGVNETPKKKSRWWKVLLVILLILLLLGAAAWFLRDYWWGKAEPYVRPLMKYLPSWIVPETPAEITVSELDEEAIAVADSIFAEADSMFVEETVGEDIDAAELEEEENTQYLEQDRQMLLNGYTPAYAQQVPVRETVSIINGSRLTMVALRAYGHKDFWVYIYDANRDVLSSPGAVKPGMTLRIPDMDPLIVDPNNAECLAKAQELAKKY
ncbi:MAG: HU family DNA-binding protein [Paludibacteraceae bacterium]|nr:HU family DNA-binding protein [Paludibacteraceae bacterium]